MVELCGMLCWILLKTAIIRCVQWGYKWMIGFSNDTQVAYGV